MICHLAPALGREFFRRLKGLPVSAYLYTLLLAPGAWILLALARKLQRAARRRVPAFHTTTPLDAAQIKEVGTDIEARSISWEEPNRAATPPLHIAGSGERYSTLTGVCWLDEHRFVVNHRSGLKVALFDVRRGDAPIATADLPCLTDDIAAKRIDEHTWEVAMSGCWERDCLLYRLIADARPRFEFVAERPQTVRTFSHGVAYDPDGQLCLAFSTGEQPRIEIGGRTVLLPKPWGARNVCVDQASGALYAVAVSNTPKRSAYRVTATSLWSSADVGQSWECLGIIANVHSDACQVHAGKIWFGDQVDNRVLGFDLVRRTVDSIIRGGAINFPHGLSISRTGVLAVTNYGSSTITLLDLETMQSCPAMAV